MRLLRNKTHIDFMGKGKLCVALSILALVLCAVSLFTRGMNLGLDFTGGTVIEVGYPQAVEVDALRAQLDKAGIQHAQVQHFGSSSEVLVRLAPHEGLSSAQQSSQVLEALRAGNAGAELRRVEFVGPQVGDELKNDGALAMLFALIGIAVYLALRFEWRLAVGAIASTVHDVVVCVGIFSVLQIEFDLATLAAVLALVGYSVNDTVVVFDRIRENFRRMRKETPFQVMNAAINETLSRTIMTSMTVLLSVVVLYFFGGAAMRGFGLVMIIGVIFGTYSSIYVASATALHLGLSREDLVPKAKEDLDHIP